jgi:hypothetical protein
VIGLGLVVVAVATIRQVLVLQAAAELLIPFVMYTLGALAQIVSNQLGGLLDPLLNEVWDSDFHKGRNIGDQISMIIGVGEIMIGVFALLAAVTVTVGGGGVAIGSGGTLALPAAGVVIAVDVPLVFVGVVAIAGGAILMMSASRGNGGRTHKYAGMTVRQILAKKKGSIKNAPL